MSEAPKVFLHVLIPAYGPSPFLREALEAALQVSGDVAVTVVDDGSPTQHVARVARSLAPRVEYVRLARNLGVAGAFQRCAELSRGRYTLITGSDDLLMPSYAVTVRQLVDRCSDPEMVLPSVQVVDERGRPWLPMPDRVKRLLAPRGRRPRVLRGNRLAASLLTGNWLYFPALAWRTDVLQANGFRSDMTTALDLDLVLRLVFDGARLTWSPQVCFRYRRHAQSVSSAEARDGERFLEEDVLHRWARQEAVSRGWRRAALAARLHATSRLHRLMAARAS